MPRCARLKSFDSTYCIMGTHAHLLIDAAGSDISKVMHSINQCYAQYFNRKYQSTGIYFRTASKVK